MKFFVLVDKLRLTTGLGLHFLLLALPTSHSALIVLAITGILLARSHDIRSPATPVDKATLLFLAGGLLNFMFFLWLFPGNHSNIWFIFLCIPMLLVYISAKKTNQNIFIWFSCTALVISLEIVFSYLNYGVTTTPEQWIHHVSSLLIIVPNDTIFIALITPFSMYLIQTSQPFMVRILAALSLLMTLSAIIAVQSRSATILFFLGIAGWTLSTKPAFIPEFRHTKQKLYIRVVFFSLVVVLGIISFSGKPFSTWDSRILPFLISSWMFLDAPLFGQGIFSFAFIYDKYLSNAVALLSNTGITLDVRSMAWAHNLYLETLAEQGIVGFSMLTLLIWCVLSCLQQNKSDANAALKISFVCFLIAGIIEMTLTRYWCSMFLAFYLGFASSQCYPTTGKSTDVEDSSI